MRQLYNEIDRILDRVDFNCIWQGFSRFPFALYTQDRVCLKEDEIPYDRRFLGNTSIEYEGEYIAIWMIDDPAAEDPEVLAADLVHEMFHAFQRKMGEKRFPQDLHMLNYPDHEENFVVKYSEHLILAKALQSEDETEKKRLVMDFMAARKYRHALIGDIIHQEYLSETIEGLAEYAGSMALKQISAEKYSQRIRRYLGQLQAFDSRLFCVRQMLYYTGAVFCILLAEIEMNFFHRLGTETLPLFELLAQSAIPKKPEVEFDAALLSHHFLQYQQEKAQRFRDFLSSHREETTIEAFICGYDPMNMIKMDDNILCSHFIMLQSQDNKEPHFIQGPVLVNLERGSVNKVASYIK